jgi:hypothetical protein
MHSATEFMRQPPALEVRRAEEIDGDVAVADTVGQLGRDGREEGADRGDE